MTARDYALFMLDRIRLPGWPTRLLHGDPTPPDDPRDLALAEQIRAGVITNHALLEFQIAHYVDKPNRLEPLVRKMLAAGIYQIRFLNRIPPPAIVDETVEQARRLGRPHAAGLVNAVLRRALREPEFPLPDPQGDPEKYAAIALSHPADMVSRLLTTLSAEDMIKFCQNDNREPPTLLRLFKGASVEQLGGGEISVFPHERAGMYVVQGAKRATLADWARRGIAQVQDATAAAVVDQLDLQPGLDALDCCAGLGTKTLQLLEGVGPDGWVMAIDPAPQRCEMFRELLQSRGIDRVAVVQSSGPGEVPELKRPAFDRMLVDAPCSNSGVIARRPEARYRQDAKTIDSLAKLQDRILAAAAPYLRPDGLMVYSTCSVWPEENQQRIEHFLASHSDYQLVRSQLTWPSYDADPSTYHDGGYFALLKRGS